MNRKRKREREKERKRERKKTYLFECYVCFFFFLTGKTFLYVSKARCKSLCRTAEIPTKLNNLKKQTWMNEQRGMELSNTKQNMN